MLLFYGFLIYFSLREANRIARYKVGNQHKTVAQTLCNIAILYFSANELLAAEATFRDALDIYRAVWAADSDRDACMAQLTDTLCNIGSILNKRKKFSDAIAAFNEALDVRFQTKLKMLFYLMSFSYSFFSFQYGKHSCFDVPLFYGAAPTRSHGK